jgi:TATA-box binding protein (TBP) (component of TFIID and TFIIIB)
MEEEPDWRITNWVCTGISACEPFLGNCRPVRCFNSAVKIRLPKCRGVCLYFLKSKKFVYSGAKSEFEAFESVCKIFSGPDNILAFRTTNVVAVCNVGFPLVLHEVYSLLIDESAYVSLEPELFSAIVYRPDRKRSENINIFSTGRMVLCGFTDIESLKWHMQRVLLKLMTHPLV